MMKTKTPDEYALLAIHDIARMGAELTPKGEVAKDRFYLILDAIERAEESRAAPS